MIDLYSIYNINFFNTLFYQYYNIEYKDFVNSFIMDISQNLHYTITIYKKLILYILYKP